MKNSRVIAVLVVFLAAFSICAAAQDEPLRITAVELTVTAEPDINCKLSLNATIRTEGKGTLWYGFEGPAGVTFDGGAEETQSVTFGHGTGVGKGASFSADTHGTFVLKAAAVGPNGKKGPIVLSKRVPGDFTCGNGSAVASPIAPQAPAKRKAGPTG